MTKQLTNPSLWKLVSGSIRYRSHRYCLKVLTLNNLHIYTIVSIHFVLSWYLLQFYIVLVIQKYSSMFYGSTSRCFLSILAFRAGIAKLDFLVFDFRIQWFSFDRQFSIRSNTIKHQKSNPNVKALVCFFVDIWLWLVRSKKLNNILR